MVGKIICSRKIATQYQKHQIALAKVGGGEVHQNCFVTEVRGSVGEGMQWSIVTDFGHFVSRWWLGRVIFGRNGYHRYIITVFCVTMVAAGWSARR